MVSKVTSLRKRAGMMRSVAMSLPGRGMPRPVIWRRLKSVLIGGSPHVGDDAGDGGGSDHRRAHQQCPPRGAALAPDEVAVAGRGAHLAALELVVVHAEAHR